MFIPDQILGLNPWNVIYECSLGVVWCKFRFCRNSEILNFGEFVYASVWLVFGYKYRHQNQLDGLLWNLKHMLIIIMLRADYFWRSWVKVQHHNVMKNIFFVIFILVWLVVDIVTADMWCRWVAERSNWISACWISSGLNDILVSNGWFLPYANRWRSSS